LIHPTVWPQ